MIPIFIRLVAPSPPPSSVELRAAEDFLSHGLRLAGRPRLRVEQVVVRATGTGMNAVAYVRAPSSLEAESAAGAACERGLRERPELADWLVDRCELDPCFFFPVW